MTKLKTLLMAGAASLALGALPAQAQLGGAIDAGGTVNNAGAAASGAANAAGDINASGANADIETRSAADVYRDGNAAANTGANADVNTNAAGIETDGRTGLDKGTGVKAKMGMDADTPNAGIDSAAAAGSDLSGGVAAGANDAAGKGAVAADAAASSQLQSQLENKGYKNVRSGASADGHTSFVARNADGKRVDLVVDTSTGAVVSEQVRNY